MAIRRETAYTDLRELLPLFLHDFWVRPDHPIYTNAIRSMFEFRWGRMPEECDKGLSIVYAYPASSQSSIQNNCTDKFTLAFRLGITVASDSLMDLCQNYHMRLKHGLFAPGGEMVRISSNVTYKGKEYSCPNLGDFGIHKVKAFGPDSYAQVGKDCPMYTWQMLVELTMYIKSYRLLRT